MDVFSATICGAQALAYALSAVKSLTECHAALRYGRDFLSDEEASIGHLQEILNQLRYRTRLDPSLRSLLESINTTVHDILLLVQQRKGLQLVILLVIRRIEVNESFALLERKKNTLNLYLTTQNSVAIGSLKAGIPPHSAQILEMAPPRQIPFEVCVRTPSSFLALTLSQDSGYGSDTEADQKQAVLSTNSSALPARKPRSSGSTTATFVTVANKASGRGYQVIFAPTCQDIDVRHEENETDGNATQHIGKVEFVPSLLEKKDLGGKTKQEEKERGMRRFQFTTKSNKAMRGAIQFIFAPQHQTSDIMHERNISDDAHQTIGKVPNVQPPATASSEAVSRKKSLFACSMNIKGSARRE